MQQCSYFHLACEQADGRAKPRDEKVSLLWSWKFFYFHFGNRRKKSQLILTEVWILAIAAKISSKSFSEQHEDTISIGNTVLPKKNRQSLCLAKTHFNSK